MRERTLCTTLPICVAVIIAGALLARGGDLNPPPGPVGPTMHTLDEIYNAVVAPAPCPTCLWEHWQGSVGEPGGVLAVPGAGVIHGLWLPGLGHSAHVFNGSPGSGQNIAEFTISYNGGNDFGYSSQFFQLDVPFDQGLYITGSGSATVLFRSAK